MSKLGTKERIFNDVTNLDNQFNHCREIYDLIEQQARAIELSKTRLSVIFRNLTTVYKGLKEDFEYFNFICFHSQDTNKIGDFVTKDSSEMLEKMKENLDWLENFVEWNNEKMTNNCCKSFKDICDPHFPSIVKEREDDKGEK